MPEPEANANADVAPESEATRPEDKPFPWTPLYDKVVVLRRKPKEFADEEQRIAIAETHQQMQNRGVVVAVGPGRLNPHYGTTTPLAVMIGQEVLFGKHSGMDIDEHPEHVMLREDELLGYRWPED